MIALASLDISTGEFEVGEVRGRRFPGRDRAAGAGRGDRRRCAARRCRHRQVASRSRGCATTPVPAATFDSLAGERQLKAQLGVADLAAFGAFSRRELAAVGALLKYVELTQIGRRPCLRPPRRSGPSDAARHRCPDAGEPGADALAPPATASRACSPPSTAPSPAPARASWPRGSPARCATCRPSAPASTRVALPPRRRDAARGPAAHAAAHARPRPGHVAARPAARRPARPCRGARQPARGAGAARQLLRDGEGGGHRGCPGTLGAAHRRSVSRRATPALRATLLARALVGRPAAPERDGGFVRAGYSADLDAARSLRDDSRKVMAALEARYLQETGIKALKVRHNNILGYYVEVPAGAAKPLLGAAARATPSAIARPWPAPCASPPQELVETESRIVSAAERALALEQEIFAELAAAVAARGAGAGRGGRRAGRARLRGGASPRSRRRRAIRGPSSTTAPPSRSAAGAIRWSSRRCGPPEAGAVHRERLRAGERRGRQARPASDGMPPGAPVAGHRPQHGRQVHLPAPERADRGAGADGLVRAGTLRPHRRRRPPVLARRRRRRPGPRPLHLHGGDGGDGGHPEPGHRRARSSSSTRSAAAPPPSTASSIAWAVVEYLHEVSKCRALFATHYHELTALAGRLAAGRQRHHGGARVEGRDRVPAQGQGPAPPTAATASRSPSSPACRRPVTKRAAEVLGCWRRATARRPTAPP